MTIKLEADLAYRLLKKAKIQAFRGDLMRYCGGPVLGDSDIKLRHSRYHKPYDCSVEDAVYSFFPGEYVYGGPVQHHFGHLMAETVHRLVHSRVRLPGLKTLFVTLHNKPWNGFNALPAPFRDVLSLLGYTPDDIIVVNRDIEVETLHIIEQGSDLGGGLN